MPLGCCLGLTAAEMLCLGGGHTDTGPESVLERLASDLLILEQQWVSEGTLADKGPGAHATVIIPTLEWPLTALAMELQKM